MNEQKKPADSAVNASQPEVAGAGPALFVDECASYSLPLITGMRKYLGAETARRAEQIDKGLSTEALMRMLKS